MTDTMLPRDNASPTGPRSDSLGQFLEKAGKYLGTVLCQHSPTGILVVMQSIAAMFNSPQIWNDAKTQFFSDYSCDDIVTAKELYTFCLHLPPCPDIGYSEWIL